MIPEAGQAANQMGEMRLELISRRDVADGEVEINISIRLALSDGFE